MFSLELSYEFMSQHRAKVGIEGTWQAYFDLLKQALQDGDLGVKVVSINLPKDASIDGKEPSSVIGDRHT